MSKRLRLARTRKTAGYTQESFAEALGVDRSTVARWEAGDHEPLPYVRPKMARLLAVSRDKLNELLEPRPPVPVGGAVPAVGSDEPVDHVPSHGGRLLTVMIDGHPVFLLDANVLFAGRGHRRSPTRGDSGRSWSSADGTLNYAEELDSTPHTIAELSDEDLKRRNLLLGAAFTTAAFAEPALFALTMPPVANAARSAGSRRIGMTDVDILIDNVTHLRRMDFRYGSGRIRERAVQLLHHEATTLLRGSYSDSTGRALLTAVAQAARLAASMAADVGQPALAQRYYIQALDLAMHAGNQLFAARAHALCQDTSATRTAVLQAEQHYERFRPDGEPAWLSFYTEAELAADLGRALRDSNEPAHATRLMTRTLDSYEPWRVRSRCFVQTDLAAAYLIEGDHEHAAALTRDALNTAGEVNSGRTISRIRALQQQIRPLHSAGLGELDEEITAFLRRGHDGEDVTT